MTCAITDFPEPQTLETLSGKLPHIQQSPKVEGTLALIVRRPHVDAREVLAEGDLSLLEGLAGDTWNTRGSSRTPDGSAHPDMQLNLMNVRVIEAIAGSMKRWPLAGDQLYVDLDLSHTNVPPGTRLSIGDAVIEITPQPHTGCGKFAARFGVDALKFVNSPDGRLMGLRGVNAKVIRPGRVRAGGTVTKMLS